MSGYLGETVLDDLSNTEFKNYTKVDWALYFATGGQVDGGHHKTRVIDQIARVLNDTPVVVKLAKWDNGHEEYRVYTGEPSQTYMDWVRNYECGDDGSQTYYWDCGS